MTAVYPGGAPNTFVPSAEATGNMIVDFSRNVADFAINKWLYMVPVTKSVGYYTKMGLGQAARVLQSDGKDFLWAKGNDAPEFRDETENFEFLAYQTSRYTKGFRIDSDAAKQASWDILAQHARITAQRMITLRTLLAATVVQTAGNWPTANTSDVTSISGVVGKWDQSTTARLDIKKSLHYGLNIIRLATNGVVKGTDIKLVISPTCALAISQTQEIADFIKGSPDALAYLKGNLGPNAQFGLPEILYGVSLVIEDAVRESGRKGGTSSKGYVWDSDKPALLYRAGGSKESGGQVGPTDSNEAPTFSTVTMFMKEEMTVESKSDTDNRVEKGRVTEEYSTVLTAGVSGFLFTDALT